VRVQVSLNGAQIAAADRQLDDPALLVQLYGNLVPPVVAKPLDQPLRVLGRDTGM